MPSLISSCQCLLYPAADIDTDRLRLLRDVVLGHVELVLSVSNKEDDKTNREQVNVKEDKVCKKSHDKVDNSEFAWHGFSSVLQCVSFFFNFKTGSLSECSVLVMYCVTLRAYRPSVALSNLSTLKVPHYRSSNHDVAPVRHNVVACLAYLL